VMPLSAGHGFVFIAFLVIAGIPFWRIVKRTGMHRALSLLWFVPLVNVIFLWVFAFAEWPALKQKQPPSSSSQAT
jgi:hypothetical protein